MTDVLYTNAFISAHAAKYMLTASRIRAMLNCTSVQAVFALLEECGYEIPNKTNITDDVIIDSERTKTIKTFLENCDDEALAKCVKAEYEFKLDRKSYEIPYEELEKQLYETIEKSLEEIKDKNIQNYFKTEVIAYKKGQKQQDDVLYALACNGKNDMDTLSPLFHWYVLKQSEFKVVKTILMGKRFEFDREIIMDSMRGIYERFN